MTAAKIAQIDILTKICLNVDTLDQPCHAQNFTIKMKFWVKKLGNVYITPITTYNLCCCAPTLTGFCLGNMLSSSLPYCQVATCINRVFYSGIVEFVPPCGSLIRMQRGQCRLQCQKAYRRVSWTIPKITAKDKISTYHICYSVVFKIFSIDFRVSWGVYCAPAVSIIRDKLGNLLFYF